jgi:fibro-slime domain-containing protein
MKLALATLLVLAACGSGNNGNGNGSGGDAGAGGGAGNGSDAGSGSGAGDGSGDDADCGTLSGVIRDFHDSTKVTGANPDFEVTPANDVVVKGLVDPTITPGGKPVLSATAPSAGHIASAASFGQWYTDVSGINIDIAQDFVLAAQPDGSFLFDSSAYFPIDGQGFGNEGNPHNYHFTTELHATFPYDGGEVFTFRGDDDVWVFVNGKLAIDLGGVHSASEETINFDDRATELGITKGNEYAIDFFQAERHVTGSNFRIQTTIACFGTIF